MRLYLTILLIGCLSHFNLLKGNGSRTMLKSQSIIHALISQQSDQSNIQARKYSQIIQTIANELSKKKTRWNNDKRFIRHLFYFVHKKLLLNYKPYDTFEIMMEEGAYGCLTATILYALILDELQYDYDIVEMNYHIYLIVRTGEGRFLFESTDPSYGFVASEKEISKRLKEYEQDNLGSKCNEYTFEISLNNTITITQLIGLQFYNEAVQLYNSGSVFSTLSKLNEAAKYYKSPRISEFLEVVIGSVDKPLTLEKTILNFDELSSLIVVN